MNQHADRNAENSQRPNTGSGGQQAVHMLGRYLIKRKIGQGGMGAVYLAVDQDLRRTVALKVLPKEKAENPTLVRRFKAEAQAAAQLKHDNIVTIYEAGEADGYLYIALEYIDGTDVHNLINQRRRLQVARALEIVKQIARALEHAHSQGIVHRDIKPANLLIGRDGVVKLTDLGLARSLDENTETGITRAGTTVGTVDYMAPEQARDSKAADVRSDIYSLGCTWYHMLTGTAPFAEGSLTNKLHAHASKPPPDPRDLNPEVPEGIVAVIRRMMAKKKKDRYQNPTELLADLENTNISREVVSNNVLAALADDEESDTAAAETPPVARRATSSHELPPKERRPLSQEQTTKPSALDHLQALLPAVGTVIGVLVIAALIYNGMQHASAPPPPKTIQSTTSWMADPKDYPEHLDRAAEVNANGESTKQDGSPDRKTTDPSVAEKSAHADGPGGSKPAALPTKSYPRLDKFGRSGERPFLPVWLDNTLAVLESPVAQLKAAQFTVGKTLGKAQSAGVTKFTSLEAALKQATSRPTVIDLVDDGPFLLPETHLASRRQIMLRAAEDAQPVIILKPKLPLIDSSLLSLAFGDLILDGVHIAVQTDHLPPEGDVSLISVEGGDLVLRNSSITVRGTRNGPTVAIRLQGHAAGSNGQSPTSAHLLLQNAVIRGQQLSALSFNQQSCGAVIANSLLLGGAAPVIALTDSPADTSAGTPSGQPTRQITFLSSTLVTGKRALQFTAAGNAAAPTGTEVASVNTVFSCTDTTMDSRFLSFAGWPLNNSRGPHDPLPQALTWQTESSLFLGYGELIGADGSNNVEFPRIYDADGWQKFWKTSTDAAQFQPMHWPADLPTDVESVSIKKFQADTLPKLGVRATSGDHPGIDVALCHLPATDRIARSWSELQRPTPPAELFRSSTAKPLLVDLNKQDLGRVLATQNWMSGIRVIASGSGKCESSPIEVRGKSLTIEFAQSSGQLLVIAPKSTGKPSSRKKQGDQPALFEIENGSIEIVNGFFHFAPQPRRLYPNGLLHVQGGSFRLRGTHVIGPGLKETFQQTLIRWDRAKNAPVETSDENRTSGIIEECFFINQGKVIDAQLAGQNLFVRNSLLVSLGDLLQFDLASESNDVNGAWTCDQSTLSAGNDFVVIQGNEQPQPTESPLRCFVTETVFAPPVTVPQPSPPQPVVMKVSRNLRRSLVDWWGKSNGFAPEIETFVEFAKSSESPTEPQNLHDSWITLWGDTQIVRPLYETRGVLLTNHLPSADDIEPSHFALHADSQAIRWSSTSGPIGAPLAALKPYSQPTTAPPDSSPTKTPIKRPTVPRF